MAYQIKQRNGLASEWTAANPVLLEGEVGLETDTGKRKTGDGTQAWDLLTYENPYGDDEKTKVANLPADTNDELLNKENAFAERDGFNKNFGTSSNTVVEGNDSRLYNVRTPTVHGNEKHEVDYEVEGVAANLVDAHEATYNHTNFLTSTEKTKVGNLPEDTENELLSKQDEPAEGPFEDGDKTHLDNLVASTGGTDELGMTNEEVKSTYESNADVNEYTDAEKAKVENVPADTISILADKQGILAEGPFTDGDKTNLDALVTSGATGEFVMTDGQIKFAYENNENTNAYTDNEKAKVANVPADTITGLDGKEPAFDKNTAFNKDFGTVAGTVLEGNDPRLVGDHIPTSEKGSANGVVPLEGDTKIALIYMPEAALVSVFEVGSESAQLNLTAQQGDFACRVDENKTYVHNGGTAGDMTDWVWLRFPISMVTTVAGLTGGITKDDLLSALNVENGATADMTDEEIQEAYERGTGVYRYTNSEKTKVANLPFDTNDELSFKQNILTEGPFVDGDKYALDNLVAAGEAGELVMTDEQIKVAYENNADTNAYTDSEKDKVANVPTDTNDELDHKQDVLAEGPFVDGDKNKLDLVPSDIVSDLAAKQDILTEGPFVDGDKTKLDGLDVEAITMSDENIKIAYENNADTNAYTDSEKAKVLNVPADTNTELSGKQDVLAEGPFVDGDKTKVDNLPADTTSDLSGKQDVLAEGPFVDGDKTALDDLVSGGGGGGGGTTTAMSKMSGYAETINFAMSMETIFAPSGVPTDQYTTVSGPSSGDTFSGATTVPDGRIIMTPYGSPDIGIFTPSDNSYSGVACPDAGSYIFSGATLAPDGRVVFAPYNSTNIGIFDPSDNSYSNAACPDGGSYAFRGAVLTPDGRVVFAPYNSTNIGIFDPSDNSYNNVACSDAGSSAFAGATLTQDGRVILAPWSSTNIGIFDPSDDSYTGIACSDGSFWGAVLVPDGRVIFVPYDSTNIGIFDPSDNSYSGVACSDDWFAGAALTPDGRVIFAPGNSSNIGIFDPVDNSYTTGPSATDFIGAALTSDGRVIFAPKGASNIGIFDTGLYLRGGIMTATHRCVNNS